MMESRSFSEEILTGRPRLVKSEEKLRIAVSSSKAGARCGVFAGLKPVIANFC
jgi:hypothetical protein